MYIFVSHTQTVTLEEPDDCTRFHMEIQGLSEDIVGQALAQEDVGLLANPALAWIKIEALRRLAQGRVQPDWTTRFEGMLHYAERKGWLSNDKASVSGHCIWKDSTENSPS
ncbi:MAG TPA: hypothetical protein VFV38_22390 [Ktedonobacteraceae bacterium]|nr:hypothetical protein [Ktedonobacteraceae bacterium]